ncbi:hypothetical protein ED733_004959 [Metarhizium rileyi]|uniref:Major facilitator superfamily (MFS) profile domain-containing protein n=1 Tax=Metarhizium rileyi (strain RCEF 4871) TaxID=1649241 RepID=A0A5C6GA93_METRR|nr:hypothetical protein ED733_004959 [Metarhizium rileyi]
MTAVVAFCASIHTAAINAVAQDFDCSLTVSTLGVSTFMLGFASGPLIYAPLSEMYGRNPIYRITFLLFVLSNIGCALSPNIASLLLFRFFAGFFGSPTVTNSGGSITDLWPPSARSVPLALFTAASFLGPVVSPIAAGFLTKHTSWRWDFGLVAIMSGTVYFPMFLLLPETYRPRLLQRKAQRLGIDTSQPTLGRMLRTNLTRPIVMFVTEPILFLLSLYMALVFGILYLDFTAYPFVFMQTRHWDADKASLSFLGIGAGMVIATAASPFINRVYNRYTKKWGEPRPEARLPHLILLSWLIPIGLFWFAWTSAQSVHWASCVVAGVPFGIGYSASALAANAILRSLFAAGFPLFSRQMYISLGPAWASSILGFLTVAMAPMPGHFERMQVAETAQQLSLDESGQGAIHM